MKNSTNYPSNNGQILVERNPNGTIKKGSILNPKGKPVGAKHLSTMLLNALGSISLKEGRTYEDLLIERILYEAIARGNTSIVTLIFNYIDGQPKQGICLNTERTSGEEEESEIMEIVKRVSEELKRKKTLN